MPVEDEETKHGRVVRNSMKDKTITFLVYSVITSVGETQGKYFIDRGKRLYIRGYLLTGVSPLGLPGKVWVVH